MKYGVLTALDIEAVALKARMKNPQTKHIPPMVFYLGEVGKHEIVLAVCGVGKVNAAIGTQLMILNFAPDAIINIGIAGGLDKALRPLDLTVATDVCQHDVDTTGVGDSIGFVSTVEKVYFPCDPALVGGITAAAKAIGLDVLAGTIASGDQFIHSNERKAFIVDTFHAIAAEMEAGAIGQVCHIHGVPYVVIRSISDGGGDGAQLEYETFKTLAADQAGKLLDAFFCRA